MQMIFGIITAASGSVRPHKGDQKTAGGIIVIEKKICWTSFLEGGMLLITFSCDNIDNIAGPKLHSQNQHCHFPGWLSYNDLISKNLVWVLNWPSIDRYQSFATIFFHNFNEHTFWSLNTTTFLHQDWNIFLFNFWRQIKLIC